MKNLIPPRMLLLVTQLYVHVVFIAGLFLFSAKLSIPVIILCQVIFVGLCGTVFYHRVVTHKHPIRPIFEKPLLFLSWLGASGSAIGWAATHRMHHRYSDTPQDPHSPKYMGKIKAYWWSSSTEKSIRYVPDLLRKPLYVWQHQHYFTGLAVVHLLVGLFLPITVYWIVCIVPAFCMWLAGSLTNIACHDDEGAINSTLLGYMLAGEGWHKNHHDQSSSPMFNDYGDWGYVIYKLIRG